MAEMKRKVLILEDERVISSFIKECFEKVGYEVTIIEDDKTTFNANDYKLIFVDRDLVYQDENGNEVVSNYHNYFLKQTENKEIDKINLLARTYYISGSMLNNDYLANKLLVKAMEQWAEDDTNFCFDQEHYLLQCEYFAKMAEMNKYCKVNNDEFKQKIEKLANMYRQ
jgi:hypothetical protein